jgi:molybdopterin/thiamine biosynthesis adenylyltransferase
MNVTLVLPDSIAEEIARAANEPVEFAGVLVATPVKAPNGDLRLLANKMEWVKANAYLRQESSGLLIASEGYVQALSEAERRHGVAIWLHTHPGQNGEPVPSNHDLDVDREIAELFRIRTGSDYYGTLIVSPRANNFVFTGTVQRVSGQTDAIERLWRIGGDWRLSRAYDSASPQISPIFDRSVRAFGSSIQGTLNDLRVAVVGCGGTGSSTAEQLVRLGIRNITLIDADKLTASNVTRLYGSTPNNVGQPKVEVLRDHLLKIAPDLKCKAIKGMITFEKHARELTAADLVFGCTDDNAGRLVLSRLSTYLMVPLIDVGVVLSSDRTGRLTGIDGRVTVLSPGNACLVCRDRIDVTRAAAELMTPEERRRLEDEGYAPALRGAEPAVVAFTTAVAAAAVSELLERLIGYGPTPRPSEVLIRWHEREISTNLATPRGGHYCHPDVGKLGWGDRAPFLEQLWPEA